jgi:hypothetical protein
MKKYELLFKFVLVTFDYCNKISEKIYLKDLFWFKGSEILGHLPLLNLGLWGGRKSWHKEMRVESWSPHGSQEAERVRGRGSF